MNLSEVKVPDRPATLVELEQRHREIRAQRQELEAALRPIESELSRRALGQGDDDAVAKLVSGALPRLERDNLPEEARDIRRRLEVLIQADQELSRQVARGREKYANQVAKAYRPIHRQAARKVLAALEALVDANQEEQLLHAAVPGVRLPHLTFPNAGSFGANGGPAEYYRQFVLQTYPDLLDDEPVPAKPKGAGRLVPRRARSNGSAEPAALVAAPKD